ncbi:transposable element Tcb1 transposase [Trichonephila clavipes]|uniref:Transposable element Tcb1 transposase n=1 Tax=Trichonephila clavipes TaxID=2585209 RepID=A0A8X6V3S1_TRICX|nr:transposable element Tcb1 transposase [Trichonephila clavipes]
MKEGYGRQNGMKLSSETSHASVCNTMMVGFESGDIVERGCCIAALCTTTMILHRIICYGAVLDHSCTPLVGIAGTLNSQRYISEVLEPVVLPYLQGLATAIFQQDNA